MRDNKIDSLTCLRGLAAWWVVFYHFREAFTFNAFFNSVFSLGYLSVDLFFILSGFVIALRYSNWFKVLQLSVVLKYFSKRFERIYPLHIFILLLYLLNPLAIYFYSRAGEFGGRYEVVYFFQSVFLVQNWGYSEALKWNIPAWSISTEFAAYIVYPAWAYAMHAVVKEKLTVCLATLVALCALLPLVFMANGYTSLGDNIPNMGLLRCVLEFMVGSVIGHGFKTCASIGQPHGTKILMLSLLSLLLGVIFEIRDYFFVPAAFTLLILSFALGNVASRMFTNRFLLFLGEISFSTYLVHYLVKDWVKFLTPVISLQSFFIYIAIVFVASVLLYKYIETPGKESLKLIKTALRGSKSND